MINLESFKNFLEAGMGIIALIGVIYRIAQAENKLYKAIDSVNDYTKENTIRLSSKIEMIDYKIDDLSGKFHQIDRALRENNIQVKVRKNDIDR
jgi:peptidoglycan hydrolase CwlO-like protein